MHLIIFCIEAILLGAPYAFPDLPPLLGQIMFWAGVAGLVIYLAWLAVRNFRSHLWPIAEGLLGPLGRSTRMLIAGALVAIGAIITALGTVMFQQQWAVSTIDNAKDEKPTAQTGTWQGNRFIYDTPQPVLTKALRPEDDGKFFRFQVPNVLPNSFVQFRVEYDGGTAKALVVSHESQEVGWQSITRNTQAGVRIADDSTTVLKVHVPQNSDMTVVRLYTLWWERPTGKQSKPIVDSPAARRLSEIQQRSVAEALKGSGWQPDTVWLRYFSPCEECRKYAADLRAALVLAGWNGDFGQTNDQREDLLGLKLHVADLSNKPQTAVLLALALEKASIKFDWSPWPEIDKNRTILFAYPID